MRVLKVIATKVQSF